MDEKELLSWLQKVKREEWDGLDLSKNHITTLPPEIGQLKNLSVLDVSQTGLVEVPPEIGLLTKLRILKITKNQLTSLPEEISRLTELITLDVSENKLACLPSGLGNLSSLQHLQLSQNRLTSLPEEIAQLQNLRELDLSENELTSLPDSIKVLKNLKRLEIGNSIHISASTASQSVDIRDFLEKNPFEIEGKNRINHIPKELINLEEIGWMANELKEFPSEVFEFNKLRRLALPFNQLEKLPREIGKVRNLESLILSANNLSTLPQEIRNLTKLKLLDLGQNRLPIPPEILEKAEEPRAILNYYFSLVEQEKRSINEIKVMFVGQGSVGKTSLVKQILYNTFDQSQTKTEGISINEWQVDSNPEPTDDGSRSTFIKLNIWDFGGQEIMHATHQFFLTKRSLYLLVLDARLTQEENRVEYWLKIIQSFGGESPVLIVGNKTDQHPLDIDRTGLQKKYPNIVGVLETSAATGAGIADLKTEIARQVDALPHIHDILPETWFTVKSKLEELGKDKNFITQDEYLDLCDENDIVDDISKQTLIGFLHDLGVVLHFQDDPRLEALGILNPQWVTNGAYKILNSHELFQNQGKLTLPLLNEILNLPEYPKDKRLFIVDMMKKFELCYDIESDKSFLIPDLLPKDEPFTGEWSGALAFQYNYNVLPTSIISRFIVRMNAFIHKTVWRSGVVLKSGGNTALVKADMEDRKIYIWVTGDENTRRDFLSAIRMEFEAIHKTIAKIEALEEVPHPAYPELILDYSELIEFEHQGVSEFPKKVGSQIVICNVRELLDGVRPSNAQTKVFISYSHQDKSFARKLAKELETQGMKVWWDFDSLKGGQDWQKEIERGIKQCNFFLVALTPDAVTSEWVGNEIAYASNAQKTIIPLHLKTCDIPIGLIKKQYIDFEKQTHKTALKELREILKSQSVNKL